MLHLSVFEGPVSLMCKIIPAKKKNFSATSVGNYIKESMQKKRKKNQRL